MNEKPVQTWRDDAIASSLSALPFAVAVARSGRRRVTDLN